MGVSDSSVALCSDCSRAMYIFIYFMIPVSIFCSYICCNHWRLCWAALRRQSVRNSRDLTGLAAVVAVITILQRNIQILQLQIIQFKSYFIFKSFPSNFPLFSLGHLHLIMFFTDEAKPLEPDSDNKTRRWCLCVKLSSTVRKSSNRPPQKKQKNNKKAIFNFAVGACKVGSTFLDILISRRQIEMLLQVPLGNLRWKYWAATWEQAKIEWRRTEPERRTATM